jgi:hypothetical protein
LPSLAGCASLALGFSALKPAECGEKKTGGRGATGRQTDRQRRLFRSAERVVRAIRREVRFIAVVFGIPANPSTSAGNEVVGDAM